jgi:hypothetical protein
MVVGGLLLITASFVTLLILYLRKRKDPEIEVEQLRFESGANFTSNTSISVPVNTCSDIRI